MGKPNRKTTRLQDHDYRFGSYFVTICTKNMMHWFGEIDLGVLHSSVVGEYVKTAWEEIPQHFPLVDLDAFVVMPNHVHGILHLHGSDNSVSNGAFRANAFESPLPGSLSTIVRQYKSAVTMWARSNGFPDFAWLGRFYEHWIRDEDALERIRKYIMENPMKWEEDQFR